jgi:hypothetical protein
MGQINLSFGTNCQFLYFCIKESNMTTKEIRKEINRVIQEVPENFLEDILSYLKQIEKKSRNDIETLSDLKRIFKEDQELLEKLAK